MGHQANEGQKCPRGLGHHSEWEVYSPDAWTTVRPAHPLQIRLSRGPRCSKLLPVQNTSAPPPTQWTSSAFLSFFRCTVMAERCALHYGDHPLCTLIMSLHHPSGGAWSLGSVKAAMLTPMKLLLGEYSMYLMLQEGLWVHKINACSDSSGLCSLCFDIRIIINCRCHRYISQTFVQQTHPYRPHHYILLAYVQLYCFPIL